MEIWQAAWGFALATAVLGLAVVFVGYPALVWVASWGAKRSSHPAQVAWPRVSLVVAVRNGAALIQAKLRNASALRYPPEQLEIIVASDGSTDATVALIRAHADPRLSLLAFEQHIGKAQALNRAVAQASGQLLVFSDADALLAEDALEHLVAPFADPAIGGVCGQRLIGEAGGYLEGAQSRYVSLDSLVKQLESCRGSITSNDGKLYCIRRSLFAPIPEAVTDDLFSCLNVVAQRARFVFARKARAYIRLPSRSRVHEIARRRRVVSRSLHGLYLMRRVLDPFRFGGYAVGLAINKVGRRLVPVWLLLLLASSAMLAVRWPLARWLLLAQLMFYAAAVGHLWVDGRPRLRWLRRWTAIPFYFCLGNWGTLLGVVDFLRGQRVAKWEPIKAT